MTRYLLIFLALAATAGAHDLRAVAAPYSMAMFLDVRKPGRGYLRHGGDGYVCRHNSWSLVKQARAAGFEAKVMKITREKGLEHHAVPMINFRVDDADHWCMFSNLQHPGRRFWSSKAEPDTGWYSNRLVQLRTPGSQGFSGLDWYLGHIVKVEQATARDEAAWDIEIEHPEYRSADREVQ